MSNLGFVSTESVTLSGDERELGKVCVRLSYQEALEQVWITLVQVRLHAFEVQGHRGTECSFVPPLHCLSMGPLSVQVPESCIMFSSSQCSINFGLDA